MKKLLLLLSLFLLSCSTENDNSLSNENNPIAVGTAVISYNGATKTYNNYNKLDVGYIENLDDTKPTFHWYNTTNGVLLTLALGKNETPTQIICFTHNGSKSISYRIGNSPFINCTNTQFSYEVIENNRLKGVFSSNEINGTFDKVPYNTN